MKFKLLFILVFITCISYTQAPNNSSKIIEYLGVERYEGTLQNNPGLISFLNAKVEYGFEIIDVIPGKEDSFQQLNEIPVISKSGDATISPEAFLELYKNGTLNFLMYNFQTLPNAHSYYKLGNTGKAIIVYSVEYVNSKISQ